MATLFGKCDESMHYVNGDGTGKTKDVSDESLLWKRCKAPSFTRYNMTSFAITLNELTPGLQVEMMMYIKVFLLDFPLCIFIVLYSPF